MSSPTIQDLERRIEKAKQDKEKAEKLLRAKRKLQKERERKERTNRLCNVAGILESVIGPVNMDPGNLSDLKKYFESHKGELERFSINYVPDPYEDIEDITDDDNYDFGEDED